MTPEGLTLSDRSRVAVIGGGPAGTFFAYFLLTFLDRLDREVEVDIYEPRDFWLTGPGGCNMCGGLISESLVQALALEGIMLPGSVVQRAIDSYVLHTEAGSGRISTPTAEKRIAAVHRGGGPRTARESDWASFDAHLLKLAIARGARFFNARVRGLRLEEGRPEVTVRGVPPRLYDLVVGAVGVNSPELALFETLGIAYRRPTITHTYITEIGFGVESVRELFGSAMHVFLLNVPRLRFAALIPKGDYATLCLIGEDIDKALVSAFFGHPAVRGLLPSGWEPPTDCCHCSPRMYVAEATQPFADRVVLVGDCSVSRLYKDGIGAAFRTAKAAARTAALHGISAEAFRAHYAPTCRAITQDNRLGERLFSVVRAIQPLRLPARAILAALTDELRRSRRGRRVSSVVWDTFTGSASYGSIIRRGLHPVFLGRMTRALLRCLPWRFRPGRRIAGAEPSATWRR